jgi:hypothetical protein
MDCNCIYADYRKGQKTKPVVNMLGFCGKDLGLFGHEVGDEC